MFADWWCRTAVISLLPTMVARETTGRRRSSLLRPGSFSASSSLGVAYVTDTYSVKIQVLQSRISNRSLKKIIASHSLDVGVRKLRVEVARDKITDKPTITSHPKKFPRTKIAPPSKNIAGHTIPTTPFLPRLPLKFCLFSTSSGPFPYLHRSAPKTAHPPEQELQGDPEGALRHHVGRRRKQHPSYDLNPDVKTYSQPCPRYRPAHQS
jgi:hypothetical protein